MKKLFLILISVLSICTSVRSETQLKITANIKPAGVATVNLEDVRDWAQYVVQLPTQSSTSSATQTVEGFVALRVFKSDAKIKVSLSNISSDYYFTGWTSSTMPGNSTGYNAQNTSWTCVLQRGKANEEHTVTANFSPYWDIAVGSMFAYEDADGVLSIISTDVEFSLHGATSVTASLADGTLVASNFSVTDPINKTDGKKSVTISYTGVGLTLNDVIGKNVKLTLTGDNKKSKTVEIGIIAAPVLTFKGTDKGEYTISSLKADWDGEDIAIPILNPAQLMNVPIILTEDYEDDYIFLGWEITPEEGESSILYADDIRHTFQGSAIVEPIFIRNAAGYMVMHDNGHYDAGGLLGGAGWVYKMESSNGNKIYYDLNEALIDAKSIYQETTKQQFVVFDNLATFFERAQIERSPHLQQPYSGKDGTLSYRDGGYTIPKGVTLLIPGENTYRYIIPGTESYINYDMTNGSANTYYRKLIVSPGTQINVDYGGNIALYADIISYNQQYGAMPYMHGQIELGDNAQIILGDASNNTSSTNGVAALYALGYVTTSTETDEKLQNTYGKVVAYAGAKVMEALQYTDWRGGTVGSQLASGKKIFPIPQYYVQNIEAPLELHSGASEDLTTCVYVSGMTMGTTTPFIGQKNSFFILGEGCTCTKYYDRKNDRLKMIFAGKNSTPANLFIDNLTLSMSGISFSSSDFPMPLSPNLDVELKNLNMEVQYDLLMLAGSTLKVDSDCSVKLTEGIKASDKNNISHATLYVYDKDQSYYHVEASNKNIGYLGSNDWIIKPLFYTPNNSQKNELGKEKRTFETLTDAILDINGTAYIGKDYTSNSAIYTTEGGASIISSEKTGKIKFYNIGADAKTFQCVNEAIPQIEFAVTNAKLQNGDGSYVETVSAVPGTVYSYDAEADIWTTPDWEVREFDVTMPDRDYEQTVSYAFDRNDEKLNDTQFKAKISGTGYKLKNATGDLVEEIVFNYDPNQDLQASVVYRPTNINDAINQGVLTFSNTSHTSISYSTEITAKENYRPNFSVYPEEFSLGETYMGESINKTAGATTFQINVMENNVTSLITNETYFSRLSWEVVSNSNEEEFHFEFGDGMNALSDAKITFTPTSSGQKEATIKLRATYKDANNTDIHSDEVELKVTATANALKANNFALTENCQNDLKNMCVGIPVTLEFQGLTANTESLDFTFNNNGAVGSEVLKLSSEGTVYTITATSVPANMPTITISQESDGIYGAHTASAYATSIANCSPEVQWNWSDLYFGEEFTEPVVSNSDGSVTLTLTKLETKDGTEITDDAEIQKIISYNSTEKKATIGTDLEGEYIATFSFEQAEGSSHSAYTETFTSAIYARPNVLDLCVDSERVFKGVQSGSPSAYFEEDNKVVFPDEATWTMHFVGVPDILSFTPTANTQLQVQESANGSSWGTAYYAPVNADMRYDLELLPSTRYLRFTVVQNTALQNICISELNRVKANTDILYMPIAADPDNAPTTRTITFTYTSDKDLDIRFSTDDFSSVPEKLTKTSAGEYGQVTVTVTSKATTEQDARLTIQEPHQAGQVADIKLEIPIETYRFPQRLPIQLEEGKDPAKRFYYITKAYKDVEWDAATYSVNLKKQTNDVNDNPYITFAFDGAPSFISFVPLVDTEGWKIEESEDGTVWGECQNPTIEDGVLKQTLQYTSRFVCVTYIGTKMDVVKMTKVNIMSDQGAVPNPEELNLTEKNQYTDDLSVGADLQVTTVNLTNMTIETDNPNFTLSYGSTVTPVSSFALDASKIENVFGPDVVGVIPFKVFWEANKVSDFGNIIITTKIGEEIKTLATIPLVGNAGSIDSDDELYTGVPTGYTLNGSFSGIYAIDGNDGTSHRKVNLSNTYDAEGRNALFDILVIYGETTTTDGTKTITTPNGSSGSNAKTPVFIYYREDNAYKFAMMEENANAAKKLMDYWTVEKKDQPTRIYMTGFCPYASTGYTKEDEGVWYFQGVNGAKLDIYLDDCYIYSRNKTPEGRPFNGRYDGQAFSEPYVRGSGAVLVFENQDNNKDGSFDVTIHTINNNMFKSNYGCFFELMKGMRAFQVSSPIQVHLASDTHKANSVTTITFDDKWPTATTVDANGDFTTIKRTNGFLSLQKQHNNAPSIDLGNANTTVNFDGGQVELQNASVVSLNYKTTLAISFRSGLMASFPMAYGIGTDDVGGRVNFKDGTTTVIPMDIDPKFKDFYLLDVDAAGKPITTGEGANLKYRTSCLRCPTNTVVTGGSHCMLRACEDVTSKGGAPVDENGELVGIYKYPKTKPAADNAGKAPRGGWDDKNDGTGLVTPNDVPTGYKVESVTPNNNGTTVDDSDDYLNFWFTTEEESAVKPEVDKTISFWKACMTEIAAEYMSYGGAVGGDTKIFPNEEIKYLLYCQLDENISNVITAGTGTGDDKVFTYQAPVKDPTGQLSTDYLTITPSYVGDEWQNYIETVKKVTVDDQETTVDIGDDYTVTDKVYYVVPATADTWMTFTAPFNVEKLWIVETYEESKLEDTPLKKVETEEGAPEIYLNKRQSVLLEQAKHNADFAAFFGVAMALGREQTFDEIYRDYIGWAMSKDGHTDGVSTYTKRGKVQLQHYDGSNFSTAHYYLYKNNANWEINDDGNFQTAWQVVGKVNEGEILMHQGETYSLLFPYCTGCDMQFDEDGNIKYGDDGLPILSETRDYYDYWSGKFLIFESTLAVDEPHTIAGSARHQGILELAAAAGEGNSAIMTGNSTFAELIHKSENIYSYTPIMNDENFGSNLQYDYTDSENPVALEEAIQPTTAFLIANVVSPNGMPARSISRSGKILYDESGNSNQNGTTGGRIPTVGGGNDLFITSIAGGINVAVAAPQNIRVLSSTGAVVYSGYVTTAVDITLPANGIYIVSGDNEVQKILF